MNADIPMGRMAIRSIGISCFPEKRMTAKNGTSMRSSRATAHLRLLPDPPAGKEIVID